MRTFRYKLPVGEDILSITSYNKSNKEGDTIETCLPIKMTIGTCFGSPNGTDIGILHIANPCDASPDDFSQDYRNILLGKSKDWKLVHVAADEAGLINLFYQFSGTPAERDDMGVIDLDIRESPITHLSLNFMIPHRDGRPDTKYAIDVESFSSYCRTFIREYLSPDRQSEFEISSDEPDTVSITEYTDL